MWGAFSIPSRQSEEFSEQMKRELAKKYLRLAQQAAEASRASPNVLGCEEESLGDLLDEARSLIGKAGSSKSFTQDTVSSFGEG